MFVRSCGQRLVTPSIVADPGFATNQSRNETTSYFTHLEDAASSQFQHSKYQREASPLAAVVRRKDNDDRRFPAASKLALVPSHPPRRRVLLQQRPFLVCQNWGILVASNRSLARGQTLLQGTRDSASSPGQVEAAC